MIQVSIVPRGPIAIVPAVGEYQVITEASAFTSTAQSTADRLFVYPMFVGADITFDTAAIYLATAQANAAARIGIYGWNSGIVTGAPLLQDCGEVDLSSGSGIKDTPTFSFLAHNYPYWVACYVKGTSPACTVLANSSAAVPGLFPYNTSAGAAIGRMYFGTDAYPGSMPATIPSGLFANAGIAPISFFRRSA